ncbi:alpha/beta hydrolase [Terrabacter sp. BE26]|uniref:alpha/beta hydrolase n=1 Tax=Terrabacter sp. BE26 TaxID=2898152 RepID=UPI0035BE9197
MGRFEAIGDDPRVVEAQAQLWRRLAQRMGEVGREVETQVRAVATAWPEGGASVLAVRDARRCSDDAREAAHVYARAATLLAGLVEPLTRWRRQVAQLDEVWQVLSHAEEQVRAAARADLADPHSQARILEVRRQLHLAQARTGHPDTASVEAAYARLRRHAEEQVDLVGRGLDGLVMQGAAEVHGAGAGPGGVSRFRAELALLSGGTRSQGVLAPEVGLLVDAGILPSEAAGWDAASFAAYVQANPRVAAQLVARRPQAGADTGGLQGPFVLAGSGPGATGPMPLVSFETFLATLGPTSAPTLAAAGDPGWPRRLAVRGGFDALSPSEQQVAALLWPGVVGNLSGAPFGVRATANHVRIVAAVSEQERRNAALGRDAWDAVGEVHGPGPVYRWDQLERDRAHLAQLRTLAADPSRQILWFDNADDGSVVELQGALTVATVGVGVFVPGTTAELGGHETNARRSRSWVDASGGRVAMVTWMGGDLPDGIVTDAPFHDYADRLAPRLASFSHDLRQEIDQSPAARNQVPRADGRRVGPAVTVIGHSYGGAVVGTSEQYGLDADNLIHVESAGAGHAVAGIGDLSPGRCDVRRYTITAANDPIQLTQGLRVEPMQGVPSQLSRLVQSWPLEQLQALGHGADPVALDRVERLAGDHAADGHLLEPWEAHSGVLDPGAEGWLNIHRVLAGLPPARQEGSGVGALPVSPFLH